MLPAHTGQAPRPKQNFLPLSTYTATPALCSTFSQTGLTKKATARIRKKENNIFEDKKDFKKDLTEIDGRDKL